MLSDARRRLRRRPPPHRHTMSTTTTTEELKKLAGGKAIKSKNQLRRLKQKQKKLAQPGDDHQQQTNGNVDQDVTMDVDDDVKSGVKQETNDSLLMTDIDLKAPGLEAFAQVFARFQVPEDSSAVSVLLSFWWRGGGCWLLVQCIVLSLSMAAWLGSSFEVVEIESCTVILYSS